MWGWISGGGEAKSADWDPLPADEEQRRAEREAALAMLSPNRMLRVEQQQQHGPGAVHAHVPAVLQAPSTPVPMFPPVPMFRTPGVPLPTSTPSHAASPFHTPMRKVPEEYESPSKTLDFQNYSLLVDYRHLAQRLPAGMHVSPDAESAAVWAAIYFPRTGPYAGGVFRFQILLSDYPMSAPRVQFLTRLFHPLVSPSSGFMDLSAALTPWIPQRHRVWHALQAVEGAVIDPQACVAGEVQNVDAANMMRDDVRLFGVMSAQCASESRVATRDVLDGRVEVFASGFAMCAYDDSMKNLVDQAMLRDTLYLDK